MNIKIVAISLIFSVVWVSSNAQVNKQVEVTKAYVPQIESATKLKLDPDMSDTVRLKPEIDYSITPRSIRTTLSPRLYDPATVTYWEFNRPKMGYLKAGVGYPLASVADLYVSNSNPNTNYIIGYLNHEGEYAKLTNDYGDKESALNSQNRVGVAAGTYLKNRILEGELYYDCDVWSRYATSAPSVARPLYQTASFAGRFGDEFVDFQRWNYNLKADAQYFFNREGNHDILTNVGVKFGGELGCGKLISEVEYSYVGAEANYLNNSIMVTSAYSFNKGKWGFDLGVKFYHDYTSDHTNSYVNEYLLPRITIRGNINSRIQPFIEVDGDLYRNNYAALVQINPYVYEGTNLYQNSVDYSMRGGITGVILNQKLSYSLFVDYTITSNALYWYLVEVDMDDESLGRDNFYSVMGAKLQGLSANLDIEYRPIGDLTFKLGAKATDYTPSDGIGVAYDRPTFEAYLGGEYSVKRMKFGVSADLMSSRECSLAASSQAGYLNISDVTIPTALNLKAFAELSIKDDMVFFVELNNITNSKLYEWMGYREYGIGAMVGVKMQF